MKTPIMLTGLVPTITPEIYLERISRIIAGQKEFGCYVLIADCQVSPAEESNTESAVATTVRYLLSEGFDCQRSICFLQSHVPQLSELERYIRGYFMQSLEFQSEEGSADTSEIADMLMFGPTRMIGGPGDRPGFERAERIQKLVALAEFPDVTFEAVIEPAMQDRKSRELDLAEQGTVRDVLNFGGAAARIQAQKTLECVRQKIGLNYAMFE